MRKAFLHIGVQKTGTTTIQAFMAKNRLALRERGFYYPAAPGEQNHVGLTLLLGADRDDLYDLLPMAGIDPGSDLAAYSRQMLSRLANGFEKSGCQTMVLSNEHLSSRIEADESIAALRSYLLGIVDNVEIVVYLRRQDEAVLSEYSTRVQVGYTECFELLPHHLVNYDYAALLDRWAAVFGRDCITIRLFEQDSFVGGDLITDFLQTIQCSYDDKFISVPHQNIGLDVDCLEYLRRLNRILPAFIDGRPNAERADIVPQLAIISKGEKPRFSGTEANEILHHFEKSNRDVASRYLDRVDGMLFIRSPDQSAENNFTAPDNDLPMRVSAALWRLLHGFQ
jgi:hypothetical protein